MRDRPAYSFNDGPPRAVSEFLSRKSNRPSFSFREVEPAEHAVAFTVAKSAGYDILDDVREELQRALDAGLTFETFARNLKPRLVAKGWWDAAADAAPTRVPGERGTMRRLRTIYRANMRAARAAGQWERIERTTRALPFLLYQLGPSERHRPHHEAKSGWVLPADDPFWDEWFPPNGWGCKCHVRQITRREAESRGVTAEVNIPRRDVVDPVTGRTRNLPVGLDPAWSGNPGKTRSGNVQALLEGKLEAMARDAGFGAAMVSAATRDLATSWRARRIHEGAGPGLDLGAVPVAVLPEAASRLLGTAARAVRYGGETQPAKMRRLHPEAGLEQLAELHDAAGRGEDWVFADGPRRLTVFAEIGGAVWLFGLKAVGQTEIWLETWHRSNAEQLARARRGGRRRQGQAPEE